MVLWFEVDSETGVVNLDKSIIFRHDKLDFGDMPASPILEVTLGKYCAGPCVTKEARQMLRDNRYADDLGDSIESKREVMEKEGF